MSQITKPVVLDESFNAIGNAIVEKLHRQNVLLDIIAGSQIEEIADMNEIAHIVRTGHAKDVFSIGDQITVPWTDPVDGKTFAFVWNVAHIPADGVEIQDGETKPGMILVANYAHRYGVMFSQAQAIQWFETGLAAGTYYLTFTQKYGTAVAADGKVNFTLTQDIPAGGQLAAYMKSDKAVSEWTFSSYSSPDATTPIETVSVSAGQAGTLLGAFNDSNSYGLNADRAGYGSNRYKDSAIRQWLNSAGGIGSWWAPTHNFDRPPAEAATKSGFLAGFGEDFLAAIGPIKIDIATSTLSDGGVTDTVYDKFFLPSLEEMHYKPQAEGVEGVVWDYYKQASLSETPLPTGTAFAQMRHFGLENHATAQGVRLRSAYRAASHYPFYVYASGGANDGYSAINANRALAACCIC
jgi:hypothetical protein